MVTESTLVSGWVIVLAIALLAAGAATAYAFPRVRRRVQGARWVANSTYLTTLPSVRSALVVRRALLGAAAACLAIALVALSVVVARPIDRTVTTPELATRDIVLCLDVSGSMLGYDTEIIDRFLELLDTFQGERIALSIWNQTSRTVFPLTDDYGLVEEQLRIARDAMDIDFYDWYYGTLSDAEAERYITFTRGTILDEEAETSSVIGDGLASCAMLFEGSLDADQERSQSILLASDNQVYGTPLISLADAATYTTELGISLVGIYSGDYADRTDEAMQRVIVGQGGLFFQASDPGAVSGIIDEISTQQARDLDAAPEVRVVERPAAAATVAVLAMLAALGLLWGARE